MTNYIVRFTADKYGRKTGQFAADGHLTRSVDNIDQAYVFNTRMNRRGAVHRLTSLEKEKRGVEAFAVSLVPETSL